MAIRTSVPQVAAKALSSARYRRCKMLEKIVTDLEIAQAMTCSPPEVVEVLRRLAFQREHNMKHVLLTPKTCGCDRAGNCPVCDQGLNECAVCGKTESELIGTVCLGARM